MPIIAIYLASLFLLGLTCWQDMRERAVSIILFPLLLICFTAVALDDASWQAIYSDLPFNLFFLALQVAGLYGYFWFRKKEFTAVIGKYMGWGDVLFWLVACVLFSPANFIFFFMGSLLFSLLLHVLFRSLWASSFQNQVPLAGFQALFLGLLLLIKVCCPAVNLHDDYLLLGYLL